MINKEEIRRLLEKSRTVRQFLEETYTRSAGEVPTLQLVYNQEEIEMFLGRLFQDSASALEFHDATNHRIS